MRRKSLQSIRGIPPLSQTVPKVKFLIMFAGGKCKDPQYEPLYQEAAASDHIPTPAAVVIGQAVRRAWAGC